MSTQASEFVGSIPEFYDSSLGPRIFFDYADDLANRVASLKPRSVLELAAGTGIVTRRLRDALPDHCHLLASDLNTPMLEIAQKKFDPEESVLFQTVDATKLEFNDELFDTVTCQFGVMFFPDKERSYAEVFRVLKPGGHYVFNVWGSWEKNPYAELVHEVIAEFFPDDPPSFYRVPFGYHDVDVIRESVSASGFNQVEIEHVAIISAIPSAENFAQGIVFGNPVFDEIIDRDGDPEEVRNAVTRAIENTLGDSMPLQAIFIDAVKG